MLLCSSQDGGGVSVGLLIESLLTSPIHWLEIHHFWRMLNSVICRVSCIIPFLSPLLKCSRKEFFYQMCNWPPTSLNQFRSLDFLCKIDFSLHIHIEGPSHFQSVEQRGGEKAHLEVERADF